jgi:hypothetical protein
MARTGCPPPSPFEPRLCYPIRPLKRPALIGAKPKSSGRITSARHEGRFSPSSQLASRDRARGGTASVVLGGDSEVPRRGRCRQKRFLSVTCTER